MYGTTTASSANMDLRLDVNHPGASTPISPFILGSPYDIAPIASSYPFSPPPFAAYSTAFALPIEDRLAERPSPMRSPSNNGSSRYRGNTPTSNPESSFRQFRRQPSLSSVPQPSRSLAELHTEESYLQHTLRSQDARARRLIASLPSLHELQAGPVTPREARRLRKEVGALRNKIDNAAHQERLTMQRLSDLYVEIRARERWCQAWLNQQQVQEQTGYPALPEFMTSSSGWILSTGETSPGVWSPISPITSTPDIFQSPWPVDEGPRNQMSGDLGEEEQTASCGARKHDGTPEEAGEEASKLKYEFVEAEKADEEVVAWQGRLANFSLDPTYMPQSRDKRMSLPSLRFFWPDLVEDA